MSRLRGTHPRHWLVVHPHRSRYHWRRRFGYHFESLKIDVDPSIAVERSGDVLRNAINTLFKLTLEIGILRFLQVYLSNFRLLRWVDRIPKRTTEATYTKLEEVSAQIVDGKENEQHPYLMVSNRP